MRMLFLATLALATAASAEDKFPLKLAAPGGEVVLPDAGAKSAHDNWRYAAARRVGDMVYVSGVVVHRRPDEGKDVTAFKVQVRRALERLRVILDAAGTDFQHVVMINSFHVWQGPDFSGTRDEHFSAFESVIDEFMKPPYPAWTAVGTTGLLGNNGIVEVQLIAKVR